MPTHDRSHPAGISIPTLPGPMRWIVPAAACEIGPDGVLAISAAARTDWFIDPGSGATTRDAPALVTPVTGTWQLSAVVSADHRATFDAGVLVIYHDDETWAKLCLERSPQGETMVVSVVTRGVSDDCNSAVIAGHSSHLRISRLERAFAFHHSDDGQGWHLARYFRLTDHESAEVGFMAQSPTGDGCTATFRDIAFEPGLLTDLRSGA